MSMKKTRNSRSLPDDLIMDILSRLPVKTLLRFKSASKSLLNLIIRSEFVKLHLCRSQIRNSSTILLHSSEAFLAAFDFDQLQCPPVRLDTHPDVIQYNYLPWLISTCNGVVCYKNNKEYVLYNQATRAYKKVPIQVIRLGSSHVTLCQEVFAYDCISDDFKIFSFINYFNEKDQPGSETYMYSFKDNSWSTIKSPPQDHRSHISCTRIANNFLYWKNNNYDSKNTRVMRLDLSSHNYEEISLPIRVKGLWNIRLGVLNGRLHIMDQEFDLNIWMLKEDNCWTRVFHSSDSEYKHSMTDYSLEPYAYSKDGRKIIIGNMRIYKKVICCDLESQTISVVQVPGLPESGTFTVIPLPWTESLVPLG
ncbi:F-box protein CPR1-like [Silene latifolia]|uniref:F-box protein CPR1-like n=1 Tax=Silene latifolia TaxID=37657 RepID=UPI003D7866DD